MLDIVFFLVLFILMEFIAWWLHRYVMHGPLWFLHEDHHNLTGKSYQKNDFFSIFFAIPSATLIYLGVHLKVPGALGAGLGIFFYGLCYGVIHEIIIHRRLKWFRGRGWYLYALILAHREHHNSYKKEDGVNFGMLWVNRRYFQRARQSQFSK